MSLPIKLISTDFDGTIFAEFENPPIAENLQRMIGDLQSQGVKWVINTGREMASLMESLGRAQISIEPDYLVLVEREIHSHDGVRYVGLHQWNSECTRSHEELFTRILPDLPRITDWINSRFHATVYEDPYSPFCLIASNKTDAEVINEYLEEYCRTIPNLTVVRNDVYSRFSHMAYNKGTALAELTRRLGIKPEEVFAAGDHWNDVPMLSREFAHWLATPSNGIDVIKSQIRSQNGFISDLSHGYGVADALAKCLAGKS
ncbi:MAG TPA: HAD hydrolase family protein [Candidatus Polarisedimenticolia bacterium]|nr:HAD hydrolase family protein [Candidatus Polarisedimenticolia bacterium]